MRKLFTLFLAGVMLALSGSVAAQAKKYDIGVTDTEIKIGQTMMYSGPLSASSVVGRVELAYWQMVNDNGGINGRKIKLLSLDDACTPPKTVEVTRKLVEEEKVFAMMGSGCTGSAVAVQKYLNTKKVPQFFLLASAPVLHDPQNSPWTIPFMFAYEIEGELFGTFLREKHPNLKIGILSQNDDVGKSLVKGLKKGLGANVSKVVKEVTYDVGDPTVDSQVLALRDAGVEAFVNFSVQKYAVGSIRKAASLAWKPAVHLLQNTQSGKGILGPADPANAVGMTSTAWLKQVADPLWAQDKDMLEYLAFMKKYLPAENPDNTLGIYAYVSAQVQHLVLERSGNELTRDNLLKQATSIKDVSVKMMLPGAKINIGPDNYYPVRTVAFVRFDGTKWNPITQ